MNIAPIDTCLGSKAPWSPLPSDWTRRLIGSRGLLHRRCGSLSSLPRTSAVARRRAFTPYNQFSFRVAAFTEARVETPADNTNKVIQNRTFRLSQNATVSVVVSEGANGSQHIRISSDIPGRLLLHWGIEGGQTQKSGWHLPSNASRPEGTIEYKKRALQTPFGAANDGNQEVYVVLSGTDVADYIDFVLKDTATGKWYDLNSTNFRVELRSSISEAAPTEQTGQQAVSTSHGDSAADDGGSADMQQQQASRRLLPQSQIPPIPQDLAGVWSYMKWEADGCPNRSKEEADREYDASLKELALLLRQGVTLDFLRGVSCDGVGRYIQFMAEQKQAWETKPLKVPSDAVPKAESKKEKRKDDDPALNAAAARLPQDLINTKAYLMWEAAGRPDGADFGAQAQEALAMQLVAGKSLEDLEKEVRGPQPESTPEHSEAPPAPGPAIEVVVGDSIGMRERNPLDLVNRSFAPRLAEKAAKKETPLGPLQQAAGEDDTIVWSRTYALGSKSELLVTVYQEDPSDRNSPVRVTLTSDAASSLVLHWGVKKAGRSATWKVPPASLLPDDSVLLKDGIAAETPFTGCTEEECYVEIGGAVVPLQRAAIELPPGHGLTALTFVIRSEDGSRWWNDGGANFTVPVPGPLASRTSSQDPATAFEDDLSRIIVDCEVNTGAWTLMHRFNKAAELIAGVITGVYSPADDAMAKIFVWLRYSAIRQLTWQRNYNTQPRILGAAQERLTHAIADAYDRLQGPAQDWARLCLTTVGRGGNAQAVRDEILNIMHRNKISEVKGTWMEEFHQKLHNNTTPDDVPICEAYLAFLRSNGDNGAYWRVLSDSGISRSRLESFDRPIVTEPVFYPDKKDALIRDFGRYLGILKATHSGADLQASAGAASQSVPGSAKGYLGYVLTHSNDAAVLPLIEAAVEARTELVSILTSSRELLYLDLALENVVRSAAERGAAATGTGAANLVAPLLQNLAVSLGDNEEVCYCLKAWQELPEAVRCGRQPAKDDALRAMAVLDRVRRALTDVSDRIGASIGPISSAYGEAFGAEPWAVQLFAEEVVRGGPAFAVSLVLSSIEPGLRAAAELGSWQVISPATSVFGRLEVVPDLHGIQDRVYDEPTVLLARRVSGEEEVPSGVVALLSGDAPDVLSHLSVRARNMRVLFAACYDSIALDELALAEGTALQLNTTAAGAVTWTQVDSSSSSTSTSMSDANDQNFSHHRHRHRKIKMEIPRWSGQWAVGMDAFKNGVVGAKSKNLAGLRGRLPSWIKLPASVTVPFGSFEEILEKTPENSDLRRALADEISAVTNHSTASVHLAACRELAAKIIVPEEVQTSLRAELQAAGVPVPTGPGPASWDAALGALRSVWASKYNERAFISTRKVGINFNDVRMAVLVQSVVPARYAFVIHTTNPTTGDDGEIYCEMVRGLGEAIVSGTVLGAAMTFVARKDALDDPRVLLYPSKSEGMFVPDGSLIFRSDSNGEDLEGYAGAGLYDSVPTAPTERCVVDYSSDPIVADPVFAKELMTRICRVGAELEGALGGAQDIEGVVDHNLDITVVQTRPQM